MAQKAHPISVRLQGIAPWKTMWNAPKQQTASEFSIQRIASEYVHRFYNNYGFEVLHYRAINNQNTTVYYISLRKTKNSLDIYPLRFNQTLPVAIRPDKKKSVARFYQEKVVTTSGGEESIGDGIVDKNSYPVQRKTTSQQFFKERDLNKNLSVYAPEAEILLPGLRKLSARDVVIIKSHPQFYRDSGVPGPYLATFIRDQILLSVKRKRRLMPLKYFRTVAGFLESFLGNQLRGIKIQIKGRLPRMGSAGAARSKHLVLSSGALSLQRFSAPMDYSCVDLCTKSGLSSIRVWVSYSSPVRPTKLDEKEKN
jgi:hypothetical protein